MTIPHDAPQNQKSDGSMIIRCHDLVLEFFRGDVAKKQKWFDCPNPMLGNVAPNDMINVGRVGKLLKFIEAQLGEN